MSHHWINNLLSGWIWTCHKHTQHPLVTYGPLVSLAWIKLVSSGNRGLWSVHIYDKTCIEISLLDTGNLQCDLNLHMSDIYPCSCTHSWHQSSSCNYVACHLYHSCDQVVWASQRTSSSCACLLEGLCTGASSNWSEPPGGHTTCLLCLAVTFELSIFFASCLTMLAGNLSRSILLSLIVLETNSLSLRKN